MAITLFQHNKEAYEKAVAMLAEKGKAAVIHPTGTGKSFIGFKLCEDNPKKTVCWLSPSEYIFRTQLENLKDKTLAEKYPRQGTGQTDTAFLQTRQAETEAHTGHSGKANELQMPDNIRFYTYAKLMNLSEDELVQIKPDYIILDEFHRCGAKVWGEGVQKLLRLYPGTPVLGLSATAVRYLDNQRDMSDELFDGNIASEMSLGEAIVRGILNPPKYILSVYSYRETLEKYERRVRRVRLKEKRERAEKYLEALRRAVEKADGLDLIFARHMTDKTGKYIVFCANYEAMQEAVEKAAEWFRPVDDNPHVYSVYSEDSEADRVFRDFKRDEDGEHLKLLFCIDVLNEGVHVEGISGVILLRPTVSPIIYKQQIGRALSASGTTEPVIFDVVNNIENLYSIDAVREEMQEAVYLCRDSERESIVNESFTVIDELGNCLKLFDALENTLTATWDVMYLEAKRCYDRYGRLPDDNAYMTETGYPLGRWLATQRINRRKADGSISGERIAKLDAIGMDWLYADERAWNNAYHEARVFYEKNHHLDIPSAYVTENGLHLGRWYRKVRARYQEGTLSEEHKKALEQIGIRWESVLTRKWMDHYQLAQEYFRREGNLNVPLDYITEDGAKLGVWISCQRNGYGKGRLSKDQITYLEQLGMSWDRFDSKWEDGFQCAKHYAEEKGDINEVPKDYQYGNVCLLTWVRTQRTRYQSGKLSAERIKRLESIGIIWNLQAEQWNAGYAHACAYVNEHGTLKVPSRYISEDGFKLKSWLNNQITRYKNGRLTDEQKSKLEVIGMKWNKNFTASVPEARALERNSKIE